MKLFDFRKRQPTKITPPATPSPRLEGREAEDILSDTWSFRPSSVSDSGGPSFSGRVDGDVRVYRSHVLDESMTMHALSGVLLFLVFLGVGFCAGYRGRKR